MLDLLFVVIGLSLAVFFTIRFIISLADENGSIKSKIWTWLKNIYLAIDGMG